MDHEYEFEYPGQNNPRKAYRVHVPGLKAAFQGWDKVWQVKDLSAVGLGVYTAPGSLGLSPGQEVDVTLFRYGKLILQDLPARVSRQDEEVTAFEFLELDRRQEYELDKLVLEIQKEMIDKKKKTGQEAD